MWRSAHRWFIIKVGDLLRNPGQSDTVVFNNLLLEDVKNLNSDGVSWSILLQSVGDDTIRVVIQHLEAVLDDVCDLSGEDFQRPIEVKDFSTRFSAQEPIADDHIYDDVFPLDPHSETIDLYDFFIQSIELQQPLINIKPWNEYLLEEYSDDEDDDDEHWGWNVIFH